MKQRPIIALGKGDFDYLPYCWFDRPLVIEHSPLPVDPGVLRTTLADSCADGMIFTVPSTDLTGTLELLAEELSANAGVKLVWLDIDASAASIGNLTGMLREVAIVARDPAALVAAMSVGVRELLLDLRGDRDLKLPERCPYSGVVLSDALATPHNIRKFGASKSIAVRLPLRVARARLEWLSHERVDAIVTGDATEVVRVLQSR